MLAEQKIIDRLSKHDFIRFGQEYGPTIFDDLLDSHHHNPSVALHHFMQEMVSLSETFSFVDSAIFDALDKRSDAQLTRPHCAIIEIQKLMFISAVEFFRRYLITVLYEALRGDPKKFANILKPDLRDREILEFQDPEYYHAIDEYCRFGFVRLNENVMRDFNLEFFPHKLTIGKITRIFEMRNCAVHNNSQKTKRFLDKVGSKFDKKVMPQGAIKKPDLFRTMRYFVTIAWDIDTRFCNEHSIGRVLLD